MSEPTVPAWPTNDPTPSPIEITDPTSPDMPQAQSTVPPYIVVPDPTAAAAAP
jgi:hypothetical protein